ncbi:MICAL-like protein 1 isoform X1 [Strongylocentrotus purpuratus]|uniref:MICAL-like protein 1 n=1 Tax=Strongylocentrotus purpuratus TaxID=7668 RepID=A0A7M7NSK3_STRPU|nr:MICAL-like protein 1 isoform X1 [Strongylocentrotus purpuratus]
MALKGTKALQSWCVKVTAGYPNVKVENMTKSWKDGLAFCAVIHHFRPELIDFNSLSKKNIRENCTLAFEVAERELGIPALLDPEDMVSMASPDKLSILTYLSQYYNFFKNKESGGPPPLPSIHESDPSGKDVEVSDKGKEIRRRSFKKAKDKENKAAQSGPLPAKISLKSDKCEICSKRVYLVERQVVDGRLFHRNCFRCTKCRSTLRPDSYKLTKDPKKFECMCHSDNGDIWNLRMNPTSRAGARLAGVDEEGGTIWQNRTAKASPKRPNQPPPQLPPKSTTPAEPVMGNSKPSMPQAPERTKPPFPGAVSMHPHLMKSAARARFNASGSPVGSPQLERHPFNGSVTSLATQKDADMAASQEALNKSPAESPARPVPLPRVITKPKENGQVPTGKGTQESSTGLSTTESSSEDSKARENRESSLFSTDDESKSSSDVRSLKEGDSLGFESSDLDNISGTFNKTFRDTDDTTSAEETTAKVDVSTAEEIKEVGGDAGIEKSPTSEEPVEVGVDQNEDISVANKEKDKEEETLNTVNQTITKDQEKTDLEIGTNDVTNKSVEEGSTGDSALWDTKAELSDSFQDENSEAKKTEDVSVETNDKTVEKESKVPTQPATLEIDERTERDKDSENKLKENVSQVEGPSGKKTTDDNYDDSLNPFGDEDEEETEETGKRQSTNPFGSDEDDDGYDNNLNPFGEDEDEGNESHISDESVNPFTGSPTRETPFSLRLKSDNIRAASFSHSKRPERPPPPTILSSGSYSVKTRSQILDELKRDRETLKKKRSAPPRPPGGSPGGVTAPPRSRKSYKAPLPPQVVPPRAASDGELPNRPAKTKDGESTPTPVPQPRTGPTANGTKIEPVPSPRVKKPERPKFAPPSRAHSQGKRKAPAPPAIKREVGKDHIETSLIQQELINIEKRQRELEERGVELETNLRQDTDDDAAHDDTLLAEWFDVVNQKNKLVRREGELIAQAQQQELELQHAEIEFELRVILQKQEHERIDADATREEQLLEMLMEVVQKRNQIVERLEEDRLREEMEDREIEAMIGTGSDKKKDKKHKKKHKLGLIK